MGYTVYWENKKRIPVSKVKNTVMNAFLDNDDFDYLEKDRDFQKLLKQNRVAIVGNELWTWEDEKNIIEEWVI